MKADSTNGIVGPIKTNDNATIKANGRVSPELMEDLSAMDDHRPTRWKSQQVLYGLAWSHEDMLGISPNIMVHKLNVCLTFPPIRHKKRVFT